MTRQYNPKSYEEQKAKERELVHELAQTRKNLITVIYQLTPDIIEDRIITYFTSDKPALAEAAQKCINDIYQEGISTDQHAETIDRFFLDNKQFNELRGITRKCKEELAGEPEHQKPVSALETQWNKILSSLIELNYGYITARAKKYGNSRKDLIEDYSQEGLKALRTVLRSFNPYQGTLLSSYSFKAVQRYMAKAREKDNKTESELSLDAPASDEDETPLIETIIDEFSLDPEQAYDKQDVLNILGKLKTICYDVLTDAQYKIMELLWFTDEGPLEPAEVVTLLKTSKQNVSQAQQKAFERLRNHPEVQKLKSRVLDESNS